MNQIFPYANFITGVLVLIVGFVFHWGGQLISLLNLDFATKIGLYLLLGIMGLLCLVIWIWQFRVLKGRAMKNPEDPESRPDKQYITLCQE